MFSKSLDVLFRLSAFFVLLGRGIQHLSYDVPYRSLVWDEELWAPVFNFMSWDWHQFVTSQSNDQIINSIGSGVGIALLLCSLIALFNLRKFSVLLILSSLYFFFLSLLYTAERFFIPIQFMEYSLQMLSPLFLFIYWKYGVHKNFIITLKISLALTFVGHGLYALGLYPTPGSFIDMVISIMNCDENTARSFLKIMGSLDLLAAVLLFIPQINRYALGFCAFWGLATAFARVAEKSVFGFSHVIMTNGYEFLIRLPHFFVPIILLVYLYKKNIKKGLQFTEGL